jgi:hypothetical protein
VVERLAEETLVYDEERHRTHCLNPARAGGPGKAGGSG